MSSPHRRPLRLGTRGSPLALAQAGRIARQLSEQCGQPAVLVTVATPGDESTAPIERLGTTGVFTTTLREALLRGDVDLVVHSGKDLPTAPVPGLQVAAYPAREDPRDALVWPGGTSLDALPDGARIGTGSPRRAALLRATGRRLQIVPMRGNVGTRLRKLADGEVDAVVLAMAGLSRLGLLDAVGTPLEPSLLMPAPAQGVLAVECRTDDPVTAAQLRILDHAPTRTAAITERGFLAALDAGCSAPVGALAELTTGAGAKGAEGAEPAVRVSGVIAAPDGSSVIRAQMTGPVGDGDALGRRLAHVLLEHGGAALLDRTWHGVTDPLLGVKALPDLGDLPGPEASTPARSEERSFQSERAGFTAGMSASSGGIRLFPRSGRGRIFVTFTIRRWQRGEHATSFITGARMAKLLMVVSSARTIRLADGSDHPTGYRTEEVRKPYEAFVAAGVNVVIATPDGKVPRPDPWGLEPFFHYPQVDEDFMFSVLRRFAYHPDRVRVTFTHFSELNLVAIRRVYRGLLDTGMAPAEARKVVESAAHWAWRHNRDFIEVLAEDDEVTIRLPAMRIRQIRDEVWQESQARANRAAEALARLPGLQHPGNLAALTDDEVTGFDGIFIPGGHGSMVDFADNADVGRVLRLMHGAGKPVAALCHGPAALLSAPEVDGAWMFDGYRMTAFTDEEEDQTKAGKIGMPWYLEAGLKNRGAIFDDGDAAWVSHVVVDRNLITGQNPGSAEAVAGALLKRLGA